MTSHLLNGRGTWNRSQLRRVHFHPRRKETGTMGSPVSWASEALFVPRVQSAVPVDPIRTQAGHLRTKLSLVNPGPPRKQGALAPQGPPCPKRFAR